MPEGEDQTLLSSRQRGDGSSCVFTTLTCPDLPQRSSSAVNRTHGHCIQTILYSVLSSMLLQLYQLTSLSLRFPPCKTEIITCILGPDENETSVHPSSLYLGFPWWLSGQESTCQFRKPQFDPYFRKIPWRRKWLLAWEIPQREELGGLRFMESQKSRT